MTKTLFLFALLLPACSDPMDQEPLPDGGGPVTCGQLGDMCCIGLVNDAHTPVCNNNTKCDEASFTCVEIIPVWDVDASTP